VAFCGICGDFNPLHVDEEFAKKSMFKGRIAHGMLIASLIDPTLTAILGSGGVHLSQNVVFKAPVRLGDTVTTVSEVVEKREEKYRLVVHSTLTNQNGTVVIDGKAECMVPKSKEKEEVIEL
jgi:3-hydroxybutyryl-CoA dehydratase